MGQEQQDIPQGLIGAIWHWTSANSDPIQAVCIVLSAFAAFLVIGHASKISRREKTIEVVYSTFFGEADRKSYADFKDLIAGIETRGHSIAEYYEGGQFHDKDTFDKLLRQINQYELVSLGIRQGVFDEAFYKRWFFSQFTRDYGKLKPFIDRVREQENNQAYFCEFEGMAMRWQRKRHPVKHPGKLKKLFWVATGQDGKLARAVSAEAAC